MFELVLLERYKDGKPTGKTISKESDKAIDLWYFMHKNMPKNVQEKNGLDKNDLKKENAQKKEGE
jgi:hypothetical protein